MRNHSNRFFKRMMIAIAGIVVCFGLSGCTKSFCTNQDKANQLFGYYGNIFSDSLLLDENLEDDFDYSASSDAEKETRTKLISRQNTNRQTLFSSVVSNTAATTWYELTPVEFDFGEGVEEVDFLGYMDHKAHEFSEDNYNYWMDGTLGEIETTAQAKAVAWHVGIYAGLEFDESSKPVAVSELWTNFDLWYEDAQEDLGILACPSTSFVTAVKTYAATGYNSNTACITPTDMTFVHNDAKIYIEGKTWGQAFKEYGFLEGLFVYPLSWIVHSIVTALGESGWAQILAILVVTLLVRLVSIFSSISQTKSTNKQQKIQPLLNNLARKYPNNQTDPDERKAMAMEQAQIMKKYKIHPFRPMIFMIIQFPLFICIWSALQGSAALAGGQFLGLSLTTTASQCFTNFKNTSGAVVGIILFILMSISNILSSLTGLWFNNWKSKNINPAPVQKDENGNVIDPNKTMKWMSYIMMVFVVIMGWSLPLGMAIYWIIGAVMSIVQTLLTEALGAKARHDDLKNTGDGTSLAAIRRSAHHTDTKNPKQKKGKGKKSAEKPMWR